eukprot:2562873-Rhodomonas_salina.2
MNILSSHPLVISARRSLHLHLRGERCLVRGHWNPTPPCQPSSPNPYSNAPQPPASLACAQTRTAPIRPDQYFRTSGSVLREAWRHVEAHSAA